MGYPVTRNHPSLRFSGPHADFRNGRRMKEIRYHQAASRLPFPQGLCLVCLPRPGICHEAVGIERRLAESLLTGLLRFAECPVPENGRPGEDHLIPVMLQNETSYCSTPVPVERIQFDYCHCILPFLLSTSPVIILILRGI